LVACLLLFLATPALAGGITSWEPDTTERPRRVREPMVETPVWYGLTYSLGSRYERALNGFGRPPEYFSVIATGATPSGHTRLGVVVAGGPAWIAAPNAVYAYTIGSRGGDGTRTHYEVGLRIESRLRFPVANAD
jgi:hypothetical protein